MRLFILPTAVLLAAGCTQPTQSASSSQSAPVTSRAVDGVAGETHLHNIRQITFGGENAEAYFSNDGKWLTLQSTRDGRTCDQQYVMRIDGSGVRRISNGEGKTTCGYFFDGDRRLFFASTHANGAACPP